ncbi:hypothetical protein ACJJTC_017204 [Scirpophaga incertulas]
MVISAWLVGAVALLVVDMRTGALQQKGVLSHQCYSCSRNQTCEVPSTTVVCPAEKPLCSTFAVAPNFTSELGCAAFAKSPCSLIRNSDKTFEFSCVCMDNMCNAPFSLELEKKLVSFSNSQISNNSTQYKDMFLKFANISGDRMYRATPIVNANSTLNSSLVNTAPKKSTGEDSKVGHIIEMLPRAEPLKNLATAPSEDDEDDSEGSGAYEETKSHRPASDPAAPSSFLPARENKASHLLANLLVATPILIYSIA